MEKYNVRLEDRQRKVTKKMVENGDASNGSEAIRDAIEYYAQDLGYKNGHKKDTTLRKVSRRFADATAIMAILWVGLTWFSPAEFRLIALPLFGAAVTLYGFDRALSKWEPGVTNRIRTVFARGENA